MAPRRRVINYDDTSPAAQRGRERGINVAVGFLGMFEITDPAARRSFTADLITRELGQCEEQELFDVILGLGFMLSVAASTAAQGIAYLPDLDELEESGEVIDAGDPLGYLNTLIEITGRTADERRSGAPPDDAA